MFSSCLCLLHSEGKAAALAGKKKIGEQGDDVEGKEGEKRLKTTTSHANLHTIYFFSLICPITFNPACSSGNSCCGKVFFPVTAVLGPLGFVQAQEQVQCPGGCRSPVRDTRGAQVSNSPVPRSPIFCKPCKNSILPCSIHPFGGFDSKQAMCRVFLEYLRTAGGEGWPDIKHGPLWFPLAS